MADATLSVGVDSSQANQSLSKLEKQFDKLTGSIGQSMRRIDRMQKQFQNVIPQKTRQQLDKAKKQFEDLSNTIHKATDKVEKHTKAVSFLTKTLATAKTAATGFGGAIKKDIKEIKNAQLVTLNFGQAIQYLGISIAAFSVAGLGKLIDQYIDVTNRTRLVIKDTKDLDSTMESLYKMAQRTRTGLYDLGTLYSRLARNSKELGYSQKQMLAITENVARSMIISGASALEARNAIIQLSQAFASGKLQGDELRSVLELAPRLAQAMAKGMKVSVGSLRRLSKQGILDIKMVGDAIISSTHDLQKEFTDIKVTFGQAFEILRNSFMRLLGVQADTSSAMDKITNGIIKLSQSVDRFGKSKAWGMIISSIEFLVNNFSQLFGVMTAIIGGMLFYKMTAGIVGLVNAIKAGEIVFSKFRIILTGISTLIAGFASFGWGGLKDLITDFFKGILVTGSQIIQFFNDMTFGLTSLDKAMDSMQTKIKATYSRNVRDFENQTQAYKNALTEIAVAEKKLFKESDGKQTMLASGVYFSETEKSYQTFIKMLEQAGIKGEKYNDVLRKFKIGLVEITTAETDMASSTEVLDKNLRDAIGSTKIFNKILKASGEEGVKTYGQMLDFLVQIIAKYKEARALERKDVQDVGKDQFGELPLKRALDTTQKLRKFTIDSINIQKQFYNDPSRLQFEKQMLTLEKKRVDNIQRVSQQATGKATFQEAKKFLEARIAAGENVENELKALLNLKKAQDVLIDGEKERALLQYKANQQMEQMKLEDKIRSVAQQFHIYRDSFYQNVKRVIPFLNNEVTLTKMKAKLEHDTNMAKEIAQTKGKENQEFEIRLIREKYKYTWQQKQLEMELEDSIKRRFEILKLIEDSDKKTLSNLLKLKVTSGELTADDAKREEIRRKYDNLIAKTNATEEGMLQRRHLMLKQEIELAGASTSARMSQLNKMMQTYKDVAVFKNAEEKAIDKILELEKKTEESRTKTSKAEAEINRLLLEKRGIGASLKENDINRLAVIEEQIRAQRYLIEGEKQFQKFSEDQLKTVEKIKESWKDIGTVITNALKGAGKKFGEEAFEQATGVEFKTAKQIYDASGGNINSMIQIAKTGGTQGPQMALAEAIFQIVSKLEIFTVVMDGLVNLWLKPMNALLKPLTDALKELFDAVGELFVAIAQTLTPVLQLVADVITPLAGAIRDLTKAFLTSGAEGQMTNAQGAIGGAALGYMVGGPMGALAGGAAGIVGAQLYNFMKKDDFRRQREEKERREREERERLQRIEDGKMRRKEFEVLSKLESTISELKTNLILQTDFDKRAYNIQKEFVDNFTKATTEEQKQSALELRDLQTFELAIDRFRTSVEEFNNITNNYIEAFENFGRGDIFKDIKQIVMDLRAATTVKSEADTMIPIITQGIANIKTDDFEEKRDFLTGSGFKTMIKQFTGLDFDITDAGSRGLVAAMIQSEIQRRISDAISNYSYSGEGPIPLDQMLISYGYNPDLLGTAFDEQFYQIPLEHFINEFHGTLGDIIKQGETSVGTTNQMVDALLNLFKDSNENWATADIGQKLLALFQQYATDLQGLNALEQELEDYQNLGGLNEIEIALKRTVQGFIDNFNEIKEPTSDLEKVAEEYDTHLNDIIQIFAKYGEELEDAGYKLSDLLGPMIDAQQTQRDLILETEQEYIDEIKLRGRVISEIDKIKLAYAQEIKETNRSTMSIANKTLAVSELTYAMNREIAALSNAGEELITYTEQASTSINDIFEKFKDLLLDIDDIVNDIADTIRSIKFSELNILSGAQKAEAATQEYQALYTTAITTFERGDIETYLQFAEEYLQLQQSVLGSSVAYQNIYEKVMTDLGDMGSTSALTADAIRGKVVDRLQEQVFSLLDTMTDVYTGEQITSAKTSFGTGLELLKSSTRASSAEYSGIVGETTEDKDVQYLNSLINAVFGESGTLAQGVVQVAEELNLITDSLGTNEIRKVEIVYPTNSEPLNVDIAEQSLEKVTVGGLELIGHAIDGLRGTGSITTLAGLSALVASSPLGTRGDPVYVVPIQSANSISGGIPVEVGKIFNESGWTPTYYTVIKNALDDSKLAKTNQPFGMNFGVTDTSMNMLLPLMGLYMGASLLRTGSLFASPSRIAKGSRRGLFRSGGVPEFSTGGLLHGPAHEQGGILATNGTGMIEMEGGEYIMSKNATEAIGIPMLDEMNFGHQRNGKPIPRYRRRSGGLSQFFWGGPPKGGDFNIITERSGFNWEKALAMGIPGLVIAGMMSSRGHSAGASALAGLAGGWGAQRVMGFGDQNWTNTGGSSDPKWLSWAKDNIGSNALLAGLGLRSGGVPQYNQGGGVDWSRIIWPIINAAVFSSIVDAAMPASDIKTIHHRKGRNKWTTQEGGERPAGYQEMQMLAMLGGLGLSEYMHGEEGMFGFGRKANLFGGSRSRSRSSKANMFGFFPTRKKTPSQRVRMNWDWSSNDFDPWAIRSGGIPQFFWGGGTKRASQSKPSDLFGFNPSTYSMNSSGTAGKGDKKGLWGAFIGSLMGMWAGGALSMLAGQDPGALAGLGAGLGFMTGAGAFDDTHRSGGIPQFISGGEALPMWGGLLGLTALIASMTGGAPWSSKSSPSSSSPSSGKPMQYSSWTDMFGKTSHRASPNLTPTNTYKGKARSGNTGIHNMGVDSNWYDAFLPWKWFNRSGGIPQFYGGGMSGSRHDLGDLFGYFGQAFTIATGIGALTSMQRGATGTALGMALLSGLGGLGWSKGLYGGQKNSALKGKLGSIFIPYRSGGGIPLFGGGGFDEFTDPVRGGHTFRIHNPNKRGTSWTDYILPLLGAGIGGMAGFGSGGGSLVGALAGMAIGSGLGAYGNELLGMQGDLSKLESGGDSSTGFGMNIGEYILSLAVGANLGSVLGGALGGPVGASIGTGLGMIGGLMGGTWLKDWQNSKKRSANSRENQKARLNRVYMSGGIPKYQEGGWTDFVKSTLGLSLILGSAATLGGASTQDAVLGGLGGGLLSMGALGLFRYMTEDGTKAGQAFTPTKRPKTILQKAQNPLWFMNKALNPFASSGKAKKRGMSSSGLFSGARRSGGLPMFEDGGEPDIYEQRDNFFDQMAGRAEAEGKSLYELRHGEKAGFGTSLLKNMSSWGLGLGLLGGVLGGLAGGGQGALTGMLALGTLGTLGGMAFGDDDERTVGETLADTTINAPLWGGIGTAAIATLPLWAQGLSGGTPRTGGGDHNRPDSALNRRGRMFQERMQQPKEVTYKYGSGGSLLHEEGSWLNWLPLIGLVGGGLLGSSRGGKGLDASANLLQGMAFGSLAGTFASGYLSDTPMFSARSGGLLKYFWGGGTGESDWMGGIGSFFGSKGSTQRELLGAGLGTIGILGAMSAVANGMDPIGAFLGGALLWGGLQEGLGFGSGADPDWRRNRARKRRQNSFIGPASMRSGGTPQLFLGGFLDWLFGYRSDYGPGGYDRVMSDKPWPFKPKKWFTTTPSRYRDSHDGWFNRSGGIPMYSEGGKSRWSGLLGGLGAIGGGVAGMSSGAVAGPIGALVGGLGGALGGLLFGEHMTDQIDSGARKKAKTDDPSWTRYILPAILGLGGAKLAYDANAVSSPVAGLFMAMLVGGMGAGIGGGLTPSSFRSGGLMNGPRHRDGGIPIFMEGGEYIMSRKAVNRIGVGNLDRLNGIKSYAEGGPVTPEGKKLQGELFSGLETGSGLGSTTTTTIDDTNKLLEEANTVHKENQVVSEEVKENGKVWAHSMKNVEEENAEIAKSAKEQVERATECACGARFDMLISETAGMSKLLGEAMTEFVRITTQFMQEQKKMMEEQLKQMEESQKEGGLFNMDSDTSGLLGAALGGYAGYQASGGEWWGAGLGALGGGLFGKNNAAGMNQMGNTTMSMLPMLMMMGGSGGDTQGQTGDSQKVYVVGRGGRGRSIDKSQAKFVNGKWVEKSKGGMIHGQSHEQGGVMAELEGGEFVIQKRSVDRYGRGLFDDLNSGVIPKDKEMVGVQHMATGGPVNSPVGSSSNPIISTESSSGSTSTSVGMGYSLDGLPSGGSMDTTVMESHLSSIRSTNETIAQSVRESSNAQLRSADLQSQALADQMGGGAYQRQIDAQKQAIDHQMAAQKEMAVWQENRPHVKETLKWQGELRDVQLDNQKLSGTLMEKQIELIETQVEIMTAQFEQQKQMGEMQMGMQLMQLAGSSPALAAGLVSAKFLVDQDNALANKEEGDTFGPFGQEITNPEQRRVEAKVGATAGGVLGFMVGGPIGAAVGSAIGGALGPVLGQGVSDFAGHVQGQVDSFMEDKKDTVLGQMIELLGHPQKVLGKMWEELKAGIEAIYKGLVKELTGFIENILKFPVRLVEKMLSAGVGGQRHDFKILGIGDSYLINFTLGSKDDPHGPGSPHKMLKLMREGGYIPAKYALGGPLHGPSHEQGGIPIEAEGGEYIINKKTVNFLGQSYFDMVNSVRTQQDIDKMNKASGEALIDTRKIKEDYIRMDNGGFASGSTKDAMQTLFSASAGNSTTGTASATIKAGFEDLMPSGSIDLKVREPWWSPSNWFANGGGVGEGPKSMVDNMTKPSDKWQASIGPFGWSASSLAGRILGEQKLGAGVKLGPGLSFDAFLGGWKNGFEDGGPVMDINTEEFGPAFSESLQTATLGPIESTKEYATGSSYADGGLVTHNLLAELISVMRDKEMGVNVYTDTGEQVQSRFERFKEDELEKEDRDYGSL